MAPVILEQDGFDGFVSDHDTVVVGFVADPGDAAAFSGLARAWDDPSADVVFGLVGEGGNALFEMFGLSSTALAIFRQRVVLYLEPGLPDAQRLAQLLDRASVLDMARVRAELEAQQAETALAMRRVCPATRRGNLP